jgi:hypothetical protein
MTVSDASKLGEHRIEAIFGMETIYGGNDTSDLPNSAPDGLFKNAILASGVLQVIPLTDGLENSLSLCTIKSRDLNAEAAHSK